MSGSEEDKASRSPPCADGERAARGEAEPSALADLASVADQIFERWDADMRSGKLLSALSGNLAKGYDPRVDRIRLALAAFPELLAAAAGAKILLIGCLDEPERTVFWKLTDAIAKAEGRS